MPRPSEVKARRRDPRLTVETFGKTVVLLDGREISIANRKSRALIGYLAISDRGRDLRERLVGLLWSESDEERARASLRQTLHEVRGAFHTAGFDGLLTNKLSVELASDALEVDLLAVLAEARAGRAHRLLVEREHLLDQLMADVETIDPAFRSWLVAKRQSLQDRILRDLEQAMRNADISAAQRDALAHALINLDPTHEEAVRELIRAKNADGDVGAALGIYKKLWDLLEEEYEVEPSKETQELIAEIKLSQPPSATGPPSLPTAPAPAAPRRPTKGARLVVSLGAVDASGIVQELRYLVVAFRRELVASLVRFREWLVRDLPAGEIETQTGERDEVVLEGGAYQTDGGVRLVLTLRERGTGEYLWSEKLDIAPGRWAASQQAVVRRIASALNVSISAGRMALIASRPESDLLTYDLWLRGQATMRSFDAADWHKAAELFREVIAKRPEFGPAYSSLAQLHSSIHLAHHGVLREPLRSKQALSYAREAVRLDPVDSRALLSLGWAHLMANQHDQAATHYELAAELNESDPWTQISAALGFAFSGDHDSARDLASHALTQSLEPDPAHWGYLARVRFLGGDYAGAAQAMERAAAVPALPGWKVAILARLGNSEAAAEELGRFFEVARTRWSSEEPWSREAVTRWFLHAFPIKRADDWERLRDSLQSAGAPVNGLQHKFW